MDIRTDSRYQPHWCYRSLILARPYQKQTKQESREHPGRNHYVLYKTLIQKHPDVPRMSERRFQEIMKRSKKKWLKDYSWMIWYNLNGCNYWMSHESCTEESLKSPFLQHSWSWGVNGSYCKKMNWDTEPTSVWLRKKRIFKVLKWPCQSPDLNHTRNAAGFWNKNFMPAELKTFCMNVRWKWILWMWYYCLLRRYVFILDM